MTCDTEEIAWKLFSDLRKELVELQKIRSQIIGFKIAFVGTSIGLVAANIEKVENYLFVIPAFAAIFFDLLIHSYSFSIKRTGFYCRKYLEPILKVECDLPEDHLLWEKFMDTDEAGKNVSLWGNIGITLLAWIVGIASLFYPFKKYISVPLGICLLGLLIYDIFALYHKPPAFSKERCTFVYKKRK